MKVPLKYSAMNFLLLALSRMLETPIIVIYPFYVEIVLFVNFVYIIILNGILKTRMTWPYGAFQIGHIAFDNWDPYRWRRDQEWHWNYRENQVPGMDADINSSLLKQKLWPQLKYLHVPSLIIQLLIQTAHRTKMLSL